LLIILGIYIFIWAKRTFGIGAALFSLFFYSFSPTFWLMVDIVTTDVAAAAGFFIALYYFVNWQLAMF